jgi:outer membrane protein assembly factor BamB
MLKKRKEKPAQETTQKKQLRLWPGVAAGILLLLFKFIVPAVIPDALPLVMLGGLLFGLIIIVWWAFFSRAPRFERWGGLILMIIALFTVRFFLHETIARAGMGWLFPILAIPILSLAIVAWVLVSRRFPDVIRRLTMVVTILLAIGGWAFIRTGGLNNEGDSDFRWRWSKTPEEQLLARVEEDPESPPLALDTAESGLFWPGFRGHHRDSIIRGVRIKADWSESPPVELWRRPVGPGWSSFAVQGGLFYTQEQRGEDETVSCYNIATGNPVWRHQDTARFWESNSGSGPRGTPTLHEDRVYTLGATGILNVLDALDGSVVWSRNAAEDTQTQIPVWGIASSPLVVDDIVIVAAAGSLIAYELVTGEPRWSRPAGGDCYSSPHLLTIDGVRQVLLLNETGAIGLTPLDGTLLWEHSWPGHPIVQPTLIADGDILISADERSGVRRLTISQGPGGWSVEERWTSARLKPYFNDSVIHDGHAYGFDGPRLSCIDILDGTRKWKGGRYGRGQIVLMADQDLLLVMSEKGQLALVMATPDEFMELTRFLAVEGKTWNHPVLVGDVLLVRNSQEMTAFRLSLEQE